MEPELKFVEAENREASLEFVHFLGGRDIEAKLIYNVKKIGSNLTIPDNGINIECLIGSATHSSASANAKQNGIAYEKLSIIERMNYLTKYYKTHGNHYAVTSFNFNKEYEKIIILNIATLAEQFANLFFLMFSNRKYNPLEYEEVANSRRDALYFYFVYKDIRFRKEYISEGY